MTTSTPLDTADDLFLRLGSQAYFRAQLQDVLGHTFGTPITTSGDTADDILLRLGDQSLFRTALLTSTAAGAGLAVLKLLVAPAISGVQQVGQVLTAGQGTWAGSPTGFGYQWNRNGAPIAGAIAATYTPVAADLLASLTATVTATNAVGSLANTTASVVAVSRVLNNGDTVVLGGVAGVAQMNVGRSYAIGVAGPEPVTSGSGSELRFEVRAQDCDLDFDQVGTRNRAELFIAALPFYKASIFSFDLMLQGNGTVTDRPWVIPFQIHPDDALAASPVFALDIVSIGGVEVIRIDANTGPDGTHPSYRLFNTGAAQQPFSRDVWHTFRIEFTPDKNEGVGRILVTMDGAVMLNVSNVSTGFSAAVAQSYAKCGLYAGLPTQVADTGLVAHIRNAAFVIGASGTADGAYTTADNSKVTGDQG